jgi:rare lipoprotein A
MPTLHSTSLLAATVAAALAGPATALADRSAREPAREDAAKPRPQAATPLDRSGRKRVGKASFYARRFFGRPMADGTPMDPHGDNAASRTLPLGTVARVTNLETGRSAVVTIQDRGPYVAGRIIDLSPATAQQIGLTREQGLARVEVAPLLVPHADGTLRGAAPAPLS